MKMCPICKRDYAEHMRFCTRDGTKLQTDEWVKTCPECQISFSADFFKCPDHGLDLLVQPKIINIVNFCNLCNQYYPTAGADCPVHGIPLTKNKLVSIKINSDDSKPLSFSDKENISPVVASILEEIIKTGGLISQCEEEVIQVEEKLEKENLETNQVTNKEIKKALDTKNLTPPAVVPFDTLGQYAIDQVSADRKLLITLVMIVSLSVVGFAAYSFPYALQWPKVSADAKPKDSEPKYPDAQTAEPNEAEISNLSKEPEEKDIIQKFDNPVSKETSLKIDKQNKKVEELSSKLVPGVLKDKTVDKSINPIKSAKQEMTQKPSLKDSVAKNNIKTSKASNSKELSNKPTNQAKSEVKEKGNKEKQIEAPASTRVNGVNKSSDWEHSRVWDNPINEQMKSPKRQVAKVVATIVNRSRLQTPNGYVYQFDLIVKELNGVKVRWNYTSARKSSYSGNDSVVSGLLGKELDANGSLYYRMAVRLTGRCIEDWYGQIIYDCSGIDENGNNIELHKLLVLDNNFPVY